MKRPIEAPAKRPKSRAAKGPLFSGFPEHI
jgi:hypothetical protein